MVLKSKNNAIGRQKRHYLVSYLMVGLVLLAGCSSMGTTREPPPQAADGQASPEAAVLEPLSESEIKSILYRGHVEATKIFYAAGEKILFDKKPVPWAQVKPILAVDWTPAMLEKFADFYADEENILSWMYELWILFPFNDSENAEEYFIEILSQADGLISILALCPINHEEYEKQVHYLEYHDGKWLNAYAGQDYLQD